MITLLAKDEALRTVLRISLIMPGKKGFIRRELQVLKNFPINNAGNSE